jgi:hypothetical protein
MKNILADYAAIVKENTKAFRISSELQQSIDWVNSFSNLNSAHENILSISKGVPHFYDIIKVVELASPVADAIKNIDIAQLNAAASYTSEMCDSLLNRNSDLLDTIKSLSDTSSNLSNHFAAIKSPIEEYNAFWDTNIIACNIYEKIQSLITRDFIEAIINAVPYISKSDLADSDAYDFDSLSVDETSCTIKCGDDEFSTDEIRNFAINIMANVNYRQKAKRENNLLKLIFTIYNTIMVLVNFYNVVPQFAESTDYYVNDLPAYVDSTAVNIGIKAADPVYMYVINNKGTPLRIDPDAKAKILYQISFDSKLRVISEVSRWREVEFVKDDNEVLTGWVSTIDIEYEEHIK